MDIELAPKTFTPTIQNPYDASSDPNGLRTAFGTFVGIGTTRALVQLVHMPMVFTTHVSQDHGWEVRHERHILGLLSGCALSDVVTPLPGAFQTNEVIYEWPAPGIRLDGALNLVGEAYRAGLISGSDAGLLLANMHDSGLAGLGILESYGIRHLHPHRRNFGVSLRTGRAVPFDYTIAATQQTWAELVKRFPGIETMAQDDELFEQSWREGIVMAGLEAIELPSTYSDEELEEVLPHLEPLAVWAALGKVGLAEVSEDDIKQVMAAQARVIANAPDVRYPKDTLSEHLRWRVRRLGKMAQQFVADARL
ncbi:MAG TPA: hypothetical protein VLE99_00025 [Candidatus Saccharimonadales bacterium]|nr:hypothetical protein [Candidatus Saccharimonadales bacterium]